MNENPLVYVHAPDPNTKALLELAAEELSEDLPDARVQLIKQLSPPADHAPDTPTVLVLSGQLALSELPEWTRTNVQLVIFQPEDLEDVPLWANETPCFAPYDGLNPRGSLQSAIIDKVKETIETLLTTDADTTLTPHADTTPDPLPHPDQSLRLPQPAAQQLLDALADRYRTLGPDAFRVSGGFRLPNGWSLGVAQPQYILRQLLAHTADDLPTSMAAWQRVLGSVNKLEKTG